MNKFDSVQVFISGLEFGYLGADVVIIMDASLAKHVCKVSEMSGQLISVKLLFKNKISLTVLGLYVDATLEKRLAHSYVINSIVAEALNGSTFIVLGGDFNENDSGHSASFKKCLNLGLFDSLHGFSLHRLPTWSNLRGVQKCIDFILVSDGLHISSVSDKVWKKFRDVSLVAFSKSAGDFEYHTTEVHSAAEATLMKTWSRDSGATGNYLGS
ncbi:hypothetical protein G9A89_018700 [Geosiphon pyriformis]|nr:hypothetical protein G9A89_018700 [Geosiphon pyriformis]